MDLLLAFGLAAIVGAAAIAVVIVWSTQRAAGLAITTRFQAGEYILDTGDPPPRWLKRRRRFPLPTRSASAPAELIAKLDDLIRFFQHCRFFEDEWAREQTLAQLAAIRQDWLERDAALLQRENSPHRKLAHDDRGSAASTVASQSDGVAAGRVQGGARKLPLQ